MTRLLETLILYAMLTIFAIYGVLYLAPRVGHALSNRLESAVKIGTPTL